MFTHSGEKEETIVVKTPRVSILVPIDSKVIDTVELKMRAKRAIEARQSTSKHEA